MGRREEIEEEMSRWTGLETVMKVCDMGRLDDWAIIDTSVFEIRRLVLDGWYTPCELESGTG